MSTTSSARFIDSVWFDIFQVPFRPLVMHTFFVCDVSSRRSPDLLSAMADRFQALPLSFMRFHGGTDVDAVLDAMDYAVYANDVQHIILDNLQFMLTRSTREGQGTKRTGPWDKFDAQVHLSFVSCFDLSLWKKENIIIITIIMVGLPYYY